MKKYINIAFIYALLSMASGVFYREFTKVNGFTGKTTLSVTHLHFFVLGSVVFMLIALYSEMTDLTSQKQFGTFMKLYNIGLPFMVIMFYVRGIVQVLALETSKGMNAAISGIAGIAHIITGVSIVMLFMALKKTSLKK